MKVESADGIELLLDAGLERRITGSADVEIRGADGRWTLLEVKVLRHSPSPTELHRVLDIMEKNGHAAVLFVVAKAGVALTQAAHSDSRVAYASLDDGMVFFQGELYRAGQRDLPAVAPTPRPSWTRFAALRVFALLDQAVLTQSDIARLTGVTHVAVRKQLPQLEPLLERTGRGWRTTDRTVCWDQFMADYPGSRGLATFWTATGTITDQLERVQRATKARGGTLALSGDAAADFYAPWRQPTRVTAYLTELPPLEEHGFAEVRAADATVELRIAKDPTVLPMSRAWPTSVDRSARHYVDPLIAGWDLAQTHGGDVASAVEHLRAQVMKESLWS
ncbi:MAG: hypothetical protein WA006_01465 [Rhodoglobus sp.]